MLVLPRASHSGEIALSGSRRLRSTLAAVPVLFAHAAVTTVKTKWLQQLPKQVVSHGERSHLRVRVLHFRTQRLQLPQQCSIVLCPRMLLQRCHS